jgi:hypothetical protein
MRLANLTPRCEREDGRNPVRLRRTGTVDSMLPRAAVGRDTEIDRRRPVRCPGYVVGNKASNPARVKCRGHEHCRRGFGFEPRIAKCAADREPTLPVHAYA